MILNDELGFLWVHPPKSGGTSIRSTNWHMNSDPSRATRIVEWVAGKYPTFAGNGNKAINAGHLPAWAIRDALIELGEMSMEQWTALDKFAVVRNPWDHAHSLWKFEKINERHHRHEISKDQTFTQWVHDRVNYARETFRREKIGRVRKRLPDYFTARMLAENPEDDVMHSDFNFLYFDDLSNEWAKLAHHMNRKANTIGLPQGIRINPVLPHVNASGQKNDYIAAYNEAGHEIIRWIQEIYEPEFEFFGWQLPEGIEVPPGLLKKYPAKLAQGHAYARKHRHAQSRPGKTDQGQETQD
jgi:hypothetical protein